MTKRRGALSRVARVTRVRALKTARRGTSDARHRWAMGRGTLTPRPRARADPFAPRARYVAADASFAHARGAGRSRPRSSRLCAPIRACRASPVLVFGVGVRHLDMTRVLRVARPVIAQREAGPVMGLHSSHPHEANARSRPGATGDAGADGMAPSAPLQFRGEGAEPFRRSLLPFTGAALFAAVVAALSSCVTPP